MGEIKYSGSRLKDHFNGQELPGMDFESLLSEAEGNASTNWDIEFCSGIREKFTLYGHQMFLSDKQLKILERLAWR